MAYSITYRKFPENRFKRIRRKSWEAVLNWVQKNISDCSVVHIRNLEETGEVWV